MTVLVDDHLLRDLLADEVSNELADVLAVHEVATTNLYYLRLCKSVTSARGGALVGAWPPDRRAALGGALVSLPQSMQIVPMSTLALRMAQLADRHRISSLGAEAVAAAEHLRAPLCVWAGDDGPAIRAAVTSVGGTYQTIDR